MPLVLRVDVDKPYGRANLFQKILSKTREDIWGPAIGALGYGKAAKALADYLHQSRVGAFFSFRLCTMPSRAQLQEYVDQGHRVGLHAENTRNSSTFEKEVAAFKKASGFSQVDFFTKHGSGTLKLGRHHYPPYEEDKYRLWSKEFGIAFPFGNGTISDADWQREGVLTDMFWVNHLYRDTERYPLQWALDQARQKTLVVLIHPENYYAVPTVRRDMDAVLNLSHKQGIPWITDLT